jgi:uncharacterized DUF497 family protein
MFEWDLAKSLQNLIKHGVSFEDLTSVFIDDRAIEWIDESHSKQEIRYKRIGLAVDQRILIVIFTLRQTRDGKEIIRIISGRQANKKERQAYKR